MIEKVNKEEVLLILAISAIYAPFMWVMVSKAGFRKEKRWVWFGFLSFPPLTTKFLVISGIAHLLFTVFRWPIHKELRELREEVGELRKRLSSYEAVNQFDPETEINRLRGEMGLNQVKKPKKSDDRKD